MKKAVIYCRVSSEEQTHNLSLGTQEKACREHCQRNGWEVDRVFVERGESAKTADRPALQEAMAYCHRNHATVGHLVVYAVDRLTRQSRDHHNLSDTLKRLGIVLRSATQSMVGDPSPAARFAETVIVGAGQFDNEAKAERVREGMRAALASGRWCWQPPLGYRPRHDQATGRHLGIEPDEAIAELMARAFRAVAFGASVTDVAADLQAQGLLGARGAKVAEQTLHRALRSPLYKGWLSVPGWGIEREGTHEPLVDPATWARVQRRLDPSPAAGVRQARPYRRGNPEFVLGGGFLRCQCSAPLTGTWAKGRSARYPYYRCYRCGGTTVRRERVDAAFVGLLRGLQPSAELWGAFRAEVVGAYERATGDCLARAERARKRLEAVHGRRRRLIDAFVFTEGVLTREDYDERMGELNRAAADAEVEIAAATEGTMPLDDLLDFVGHTLARPADLWQETEEPLSKRALAVAICPAGATLHGDEIATDVTASFYMAIGTAGLHSDPSDTPNGTAFQPLPAYLSPLVTDLVAFRAAWASAQGPAEARR